MNEATKKIWAYLFNRENFYALLLCILFILLLIITTSATPQWIYQGF